jgi:signal transduction histidine kinase
LLRSLHGRITFGYVAFVMVIFMVVAVVLAREAVIAYVRSANDAIQTAAGQINEIARLDPNASFTTLADDVRRSVNTSGLRIVAVSHPSGGAGFVRFPMHLPDPAANFVVITAPPQTVPGPPAKSAPPDAGSRVIFSISNLAGIHPQRVETQSGTFFISSDPNRLRGILTWYAIAFAGGLAGVGGLGLLIGNYLAHQALAPMIAVTGALERFASGDFTPQRIDTHDRTEVGELARAFNGAATQVAAAFDERRRVEEYIRQFVADASHELRTPLTVIRGYLDVLRRGALTDPDKRERALRTLDTESKRMRALIDKLIVLARLERPEPSQVTRVDVASIARHLVDAAREVPGHPDVTLDLDDGAHVLAEESELHEALANLLDNARKYGAGAPIDVQVKRGGPFVVARVIDAGPGIPAEEQPHVFDRFYRGQSRGEIEGSGLGLAIAAQAASRARGSLRLIESRPGRTVFEIKLPAAPPHDVPSRPAELVLG